jgi:O-antigen/teichoic acid export membrane protein
MLIVFLKEVNSSVEKKQTYNNRVKNTFRNIIWGLLGGFVSVFLPFITRAIILYLLGAHYLGVDTLFTSVLQFLNLTELGLGAAITYTMYKPIAENDIENICRILNYLKKMYRNIGIVMLSVGTVLIPAVPFLMHGDAPAEINIYILYYLYLINAVISYFYAGYRESLLTAYQRKDITAKWSILAGVLVQVLQIVVLLFTRNFYIYAFVPILGTVLINVLNIVVTERMYPEIKAQGMITDEARAEIRKKLSGLIGTRLSFVVHHSSDAIVASIFLGLTITAQFGIYYLFMNSVCGLITTIFAAMTASIGDKLVRDSLEDNYKLFQRISFANNWIVSWCAITFFCLIEPVISLIYSKEMCLGIGFSALMALYFYIYQIQKTILTFKDASGIWYADRYRPYVFMITNLVSNIVLVNFIGIYGIVLSTILAFLISLPWINWTLFSQLFHKSSSVNLILILKNSILTVVLGMITFLLCKLCGSGLMGIIGRSIICILIPNAIMIVIYNKSPYMKYWYNFIYSKMTNFI